MGSGVTLSTCDEIVGGNGLEGGWETATQRVESGARTFQ